MTRKEAREFAMQTIFQMDAQDDLNGEKVEEYLSEKNMREVSFKGQKQYIEKLLKGIIEDIARIDELINSSSKEWPVSRMAKADLAIIRIAVGETIYADDVPAGVAINEAVNLAKVYGTENSPKFVNAVLRSIIKTA